jgi:2-dehydro-3-deoxygluconokinase
LKTSGIDLSSVVWINDGRIATYYVEYALPPRSTQVYYDRANTCFTRLSAGEIDWEYLTDSRILHLSGLTVPLSPSLSEIITKAIRQAKSRRVHVSFDVNYRRRIWSPEQARNILLPIIEEVDILFCSRGDAFTVFGLEGDPEVIAQGLGKLSGAQYIITSLSADGLIGWDRDQMFRQPACQVQVIDRIGAGDAMVAGVLHGLLQEKFAEGLRYGAVTAGLALSQYGDQVVTTREEVEELARPGTSTDIYR